MQYLVFVFELCCTAYLLKQRIKVDEYGRRYITRKDLAEIAKFKFGDSLPLEKSVPQVFESIHILFDFV
jgi:hypothetical protein